MDLSPGSYPARAPPKRLDVRPRAPQPPAAIALGSGPAPRPAPTGSQENRFRSSRNAPPIRMRLHGEREMWYDYGCNPMRSLLLEEAARLRRGRSFRSSLGLRGSPQVTARIAADVPDEVP